MAAGSLVRRSDAPPAPAPVAEVAPVTAAPAPPTEAEPVQDTGSLADVDALLDQSPAAALSWLTAHPDAGVPAQRLLRRGLARLATEQVSAGLADLAAALVDDATLALDVRVLPAVVEALDQRDGEEAVGLLAGPLAAGAGPTLLTVAAEGGLRARWRAVEALEKAGAAEAKPARFASLRKDLRVGDCERRRKAAEALGAWGDGAAVPDLKRARGRGFLDNLCMSGEIDAALKALKDAPVSAP
ncbi:MAG: hypothetical protein H6706_21185 [Myxococcales bacterium]|nr:hypothetical protein [Myxococcales bacterium]